MPDIVIAGATFRNVPQIDIPKEGSGTASFVYEDGTKQITQNGTGIDVSGYAAVDVAVPSSSPVIQSLSVTQNGEYTAPSGVDGYSPVTVNVPGIVPSGSQTVTQNGTYDVTALAQMIVNVAGGGGNIDLIRIDPLAFDYVPGYVNASGNRWQYENTTNNRSDIYAVEEGHQYMLKFGSTVGTRCRSIVVATNPIGSTTDITGTVVSDMKDPPSYKNFSFTSPINGYFTITKDNNSTDGIVTNLYDLTASGYDWGLECEEGIWAPSSQTSKGTISFKNSHSAPPSFAIVEDVGDTYAGSNYSCVGLILVNCTKLLGHGYAYNSNNEIYAGIALNFFRGVSAQLDGTTQFIKYGSDNSGNTNTSYYRYWATESALYPYSGNSSRYWRNGRSYRWRAFWL